MEDSMFCCVWLVVYPIMGIAAAAIASSKGRNVAGWFFGGLFLGIIGIVIVAVLPNLKAQREQQEYVDREQRRLREQIRQEQLKVEALRRHSLSRLDAHDHILGVDTREGAALPGGEPSRGLLPGAAPGAALPPSAYGPAAVTVLPAGSLDPLSQYGPPPGAYAPPPWFYEHNGQVIGPVSQADIEAMIRGGQLGPFSLLWSESLTNWTMASQIEQFRPLVRG